MAKPAEQNRVAELERKVVAKHWRSIFLDDACSMRKNSGNCRHEYRLA